MSPTKPAWSQLHTLPQIDESDWASWADFLESLPAAIETPHALVTHARLDPAYGIANPNPHHTAGAGKVKGRIETDATGVPLWYRQMRLDKPVCIGHVSFDRVELVRNGLFALDTGACHGGALTAVVFPEAELRHVNVSHDHHRESLRAWRGGLSPPDQDATSWRLSHCATVLSTPPDGAPGIREAQEGIAEGLDEILREERLAPWIALLQQCFGRVPDSGPEHHRRDDQAENIRAELDDETLGSLPSRREVPSRIRSSGIFVAHLAFHDRRELS